MIITKICLAFELVERYANYDIDYQEWIDDYKSQYEEGMNLFRDHFFSLWD